TAITIATPLDRKYVTAIENLTGQPIEPIEVEASAERAAAFSKGRTERGRSQQGKDQRQPSREAAPKPKEKREEAPRSETRASSEPRRRREHDRRRDHDDVPVIGLGDHVPSFLLRPVRVPSEEPSS